MTPAARRSAPVIALVAAALLGAGCASLPDEGTVHTGAQPSPSESAAPFDFNPPGPLRGASRREIVAGFLRALQATPVTTRAAGQFLTAKAVRGWRPQQRTLVYRSQVTTPTAAGMSVRLQDAFSLDRTGRWAGALTGPARTVRLELTRSAGEWRISGLPDATIIPASHFERRYRQYSLYFFDMTASVLVPEPVYLPWGVQAPTLLVSGLLTGPRGADRAAERTFFPAGTGLGVSVPVGAAGTAEVPLSRQILRLDQDRLDRVLAQLSWTLRQTGDVTRMQLLVDGTALELPGGGTSVSVTGYEEYSPAVASASTDLFGVRGRRIVQEVGPGEITASELPSKGQPPRSLGVAMTGRQFAVVTAGGRHVVVLGRTGSQPRRPVTAYRGTDVLRPMWDYTDRLWLLDRTRSGPVVLAGQVGRLRRLPLVGVPPRVLAASLSRDGARLALAVVRGGRTQLLLSRVVRRANGAPLRLSWARPLSVPQPLRAAQAIGWRDPTTVAVLTRPSSGTSAIELVSADGSSGLVNLAPAVDVLFDRGTGLAASPGGPLALAVSTRSGRTYELDPQGRWELGSVREGLTLPTYAG